MNKSNQKPLVSVILPVFKSEKYLEACLVSLSNQSYKNIEIVAVVDYLGDKSMKILKKYKKIEPRLRIYSNLQRYGLASTLNRGISLSKGSYIAFMDSTGIANKTRISKQLKFLIKEEKVAAVGSQINIINGKSKKTAESNFPLFHEEIYKELLANQSVRFETLMVAKTRLPKDILKFRKDRPYPFIYLDVLMKIGQYKELANIEENLVSIRSISSELRRSLNPNKVSAFIKLLFESTTLYDHKPSVKTLFTPLMKQV